MQELPSDGLSKREIKSEPLTEEELGELAALAGGYDPLFSKRSRNYSKVNPEKKELSEEEMKNLILEDYTFLKRPVIVFDKKIFIGNSPKTIAEAKAALK